MDTAIPRWSSRDVRDEYVTIEGAARDYGVVIVGDLRKPEQLAVDDPATEELRRSRPSPQPGPPRPDLIPPNVPSPDGDDA